MTARHPSSPRRPSLGQRRSPSAAIERHRTTPNKPNAQFVQPHRPGLNKPNHSERPIPSKTLEIVRSGAAKKLRRQPPEHPRRPSLGQRRSPSAAIEHNRTTPNKPNAQFVQPHRPGLNKPNHSERPIPSKTLEIVRSGAAKKLRRQPPEHPRRPSLGQRRSPSAAIEHNRTTPNKPNAQFVQPHRTGLNKPNHSEHPIPSKTLEIVHSGSVEKVSRQPPEHRAIRQSPVGPLSLASLDDRSKRALVSPPTAPS